MVASINYICNNYLVINLNMLSIMSITIYVKHINYPMNYEAVVCGMVAVKV
jgi:hypothetical protein